MSLGTASAATITVDDDGCADYTSIQAAVNNSTDGDTILVYPGTYNENVDVYKQLNIKSTDGASVTNVVAESADDHVFDVTADGVTISGFSVSGAGYCKAGIYLQSCSNNILTNNNVEDNYYGIYLHYSSNNTLANNTSANNDDKGIWLDHSDSNMLTDNTVADNNDIGIFLSSSDNNMLANNNVANNSMESIRLFSSSNNTLISNTATDNYCGISLSSSDNNTLANNAAANNNGYGIELYYSSDNTLTNNNIANNSCTGIKMGSSGNNLIYNNFFNNSVNTELYGINTCNIWNTIRTPGVNIADGPNLGGNYWAKPDGTGFSQTHTDSDGDGICDVIHALDGENIDYLPLATLMDGNPGNNSVLYVTYSTTDLNNDPLYTGLIDKGFNLERSESIPECLDSYDLVIVQSYDACWQTTADYIKNYLYNGGGVVLISGVPSSFQRPDQVIGSSQGYFSIPYIAEWFGTVNYENVGLTDATVTKDNPLGTDLVNGDYLAHCPEWGGAAVSNLDQTTAQSLAMWDYSDDRIFAFINEYKAGRVFYISTYGKTENSNKLAFAGALWAANSEVQQPDPTKNVAPVASIDSITPNPALMGEIITFDGSGTDSDGTITSYYWKSSIDGQLSNDTNFSTYNLSRGTHTIYFRVQDDDGAWSSEESTTLIVKTEYSETISVDDSGGADYTTIQEAVDAANDGDTILVHPGTYNENVNVYKQLNITSTGGASVTNVVAASSDDDVFGVTADGAIISGFSVSGAEYYRAGIYIQSCSYNILTNNNVANNYCGIKLDYSGNNALTNNNVTNNQYGISLYLSDNNTLTDNTVTHNIDEGIGLHSSNNNMLINNTAANNFDGIGLGDSSNNMLISNTAANNYYAGILLSSSGNNTLTNNIATNNNWEGIRLSSSDFNTLKNNTAANNSYYGIWVDFSNNNTLRNNNMSDNLYNFAGGEANDIDTSNTVDGKPIYYLVGVSNMVLDATSNAGTVWCINCQNMSIKDMTLKNNDCGIYLFYTTNSKIENITTTKNRYGIELYSSSKNLVYNNVANNNMGGIFLIYSSYNTLMDNIAANNDYSGILLDVSSNNMLTNNTAANSSYYDGIYLSSSSNNTLTNNTIANNTRSGIELDNSSYNQIYDNFFNNSNNVIFDDYSNSKPSIGNIWNTTQTAGVNIIGSPYLGGNYWATPKGTGFSETCTDVDGDGICDSVYVLDGDNTDYLPLTDITTPEKKISSSGNGGGFGEATIRELEETEEIITSFSNTTDSATMLAQEDDKLMSVKSTEVESVDETTEEGSVTTSGFGVLLAIGVLLVVYIIHRKKDH